MMPSCASPPRQCSRCSTMATDDALAVLAAALDRSKEGPQTGPDVRLALQSLRFVGVPRDAIRYFWDGASGANEIARSQSMNAALNRIRLEIKRKHQ